MFLFWSHFNQTWIFSKDFRKVPKYQGSSLRMEWHKKFLIAFRNIVNTPTKQRSFPQDLLFTLKFTVACKESCSPDEPLRIHRQL